MKTIIVTIGLVVAVYASAIITLDPIVKKFKERSDSIEKMMLASMGDR